jgi:hypothetical protein
LLKKLRSLKEPENIIAVVWINLPLSTMSKVPFSNDPEKSEGYVDVQDSQTNLSIISDGSLKFVGEGGENSSRIGYQEASGAPVESKSPLGYSVGPVSIVFLNVGSMVGTGIFSTRECLQLYLSTSSATNIS